MSKPLIAVLGDPCLDHYVFGQEQRLNPEGGGPLLDVQATDTRPGGALNLAANIAALCPLANVVFIGGLSAAPPCVCPGVDFGAYALPQPQLYLAKTRFYSGGNAAVLRVDDRPRYPDGVGSLVYEQLARFLSQHQPQLVAVADYNKGCVSDSSQRLLSQLAALGTPVLVDSRPATMAGYEHCLLKPNAKEARQYLAGCVHPAAASHDAEELAMVMLQQLPTVRAVVCTNGSAAAGIAHRFPGGPATHRAAVFCTSRVQASPVGAGDVFLAALASRLALDPVPYQQLPAAAEYAAAAAAVSVDTLGTVIVPLHAARAEWVRADLRRKVLADAELISWAYSVRASGKQLVLANGCFDVLHAGHMELLRFAKSRGDVLLVAANTDASVTALKGADRPRVPQQVRAEQLAALGCVDAVTLFDGNVTALVAATGPTVLVKGGDYANTPPEQIGGYAQLAALGGRVEYGPYVAGFSTTALVAHHGG